MERFPQSATFLKIDVEAQILIHLPDASKVKPIYHSQVKPKASYHIPVPPTHQKYCYCVPDSGILNSCLALERILSLFTLLRMKSI